MERGYEDAYRQFIEPVLGASVSASAQLEPARDVDATRIGNRVSIVTPTCAHEGTHTKLIHAGEARGHRRHAVADDADLRDEHVRVRLGGRRHQVPGRQAQRLPLFALREPDRRGGRAEAGGGRRRRDVAAVQLRHGGDLDRAADAARSRRRDRLLRGDLRRHVSHHRGPAVEARHHASLRVARGAGESVVGDRTEDEDRLVRVADQPDAALRRHAHGRGGVQDGRRAVRRSTTPSPARSISRCCRWASTCRCRAARST